MYKYLMKSVFILLLLLTGGILFVIPSLLLQDVFAQTSALEQMIGQMRFTHSQLSNNIDEVKQLLESNNTS